MDNSYGLNRVILPTDVFPASAWELDNTRTLNNGEIRIKLNRLQIEAMSFRQICQDSRYDEDVIREKIKDIVIKRGKLHNPVTDTGGILCGTIEEISPGYYNKEGFDIGDTVASTASLACIPIYIDNVKSIDMLYSQVEVDGYAILNNYQPLAKCPDDLPLDLLLLTFNESGTVYTVGKNALGKNRFMVVGSNPMMNLLFGFSIKQSVETDAEIYCLFDTSTDIILEGENTKSLMDKVFSKVFYMNLFRPAECIKELDGIPLVDMTVNCADISGAETVSILMTKPGGTVIFTDFITNYHIALFVAESISRELHIKCAEGFLDEYIGFDLEFVRKLSPYFENASGVRKKKKKGRDSLEEKQHLRTYKSSFDLSLAEDFVAESESMRTVMEEIVSVSKYDCNVLITGQTGVGKEKIANIIQKNSSRKIEPFIKINCAAIAPNLMESEFFGYEKGAFTGASSSGKKGYFEVADNGIIFLDEAGEMPLDIQAKLLRVIQDGEFMRVGGTTPIKSNVRIISATNQNLEELVEKKLFRRDLYYRLNVFPIKLPSLKERLDDIPLLTESFINRYNQKFGINKSIEKSAQEYLQSCEWPGNIRELENFVQRLMISSKGESITLMDVMNLKHNEVSTPQIITTGDNINLTQMVEEYEKNIIKYACETYGSTRKAAKAIGISQTQLVRKKNKYEI